MNDKVSAGFKQFEAKLKTVEASIQRVGSIGLGIASAVGAPFLAAINHAKNAQESLSRFSAVFKEQSAAATAFADNLAKQVGRSAIEIKDGLSSFQSFFLGLGFAADKSRDLSQQLQALSIDFASFNNLTDEDAMGRFISAMSGSSEVVDRYGINLKVAALEQELLAMGIKKSWLADNLPNRRRSGRSATRRGHGLGRCRDRARDCPGRRGRFRRRCCCRSVAPSRAAIVRHFPARQ